MRDHPRRSLKSHETSEHFLEVDRAQASDGVPAWRRRESVRTTAGVRTLGDVVENAREQARVKLQPSPSLSATSDQTHGARSTHSRVNKADGPLAGRKPRVVDGGDHRREDGRGRGRAVEELEVAVVHNGDVPAVRGDVGHAAV